MSNWTDQIAGARMRVDQQFQDRVTNSEFSNQQWGLIMTAVQLKIDHPEDPDRAELVADTSRLPDIMPELDRVKNQLGGAQPGGGTSSGLGNMFPGLSGLLDGLLSGSNGADQERLATAEALANEYAQTLQAHLEERSRWDEIREAAAADDPTPNGGPQTDGE